MNNHSLILRGSRLETRCDEGARRERAPERRQDEEHHAIADRAEAQEQLQRPAASACSGEVEHWRVIPKSGNRFSERITRKTELGAR
jgi:hypothetical protein